MDELAYFVFSCSKQSKSIDSHESDLTCQNINLLNFYRLDSLSMGKMLVYN